MCFAHGSSISKSLYMKIKEVNFELMLAELKRGENWNIKLKWEWMVESKIYQKPSAEAYI